MPEKGSDAIFVMLKFLSVWKSLSPKTGYGIIQNLGSSVLHNKLNLYIVGFFLFWY